MSKRWMLVTATTLLLGAFVVGCGGNKVEPPKETVPPPAADGEAVAPPAIPAK